MTEIILFLVGIIVGGMNSIAGGGMLLGFPVMLAAGMPPLVANVTGNLAILPGQLTSAFGYRKFLKKTPKRYLLLLIPCVIGGAIGAFILSHTSSGTGRKGLTSLQTTDSVERPFLHVPKRELVAYAKEHNLQWREDSTNQDDAYLRNYVRHRLLAAFDETARAQFLEILESSQTTSEHIDTLLVKYMSEQIEKGKLQRVMFNKLPHSVAREVLAAWLRNHDIRDFDRKALERLVVAAKTAAPGREFPVLRGVVLRVDREYLALHIQER